MIRLDILRKLNRSNSSCGLSTSPNGSVADASCRSCAAARGGRPPAHPRRRAGDLGHPCLPAGGLRLRQRGRGSADADARSGASRTATGERMKADPSRAVERRSSFRSSFREMPVNLGAPSVFTECVSVSFLKGRSSCRRKCFTHSRAVVLSRRSSYHGIRRARVVEVAPGLRVCPGSPTHR